MNSTEEPAHFSLFDPFLESFFDLAEESDREGARTILSELSEDHQRYHITDKMAEGGSKKVVKVKDSATNRYVAMAVLKDNEHEEAVEEFLREARLTAFLQHPNIMPVYDIGVNAVNQPYFTMKLIKGGYNLASLVNAIERFSDLEVLSSRLDIFLKICDGVAYAHSRGILHLDLKPENIQLDDFGQVLVCDWGLARFTKGVDTETVTGTDKVHSMDFLNITVKGMVRGTPGFMAPEQASTTPLEKDEKTDIYALGALLYYLLSFHTPLKAGQISKMLSDTVKGNVIPLEKWKHKLEIPDALIKVCQKSMHVTPEKRYGSVVELQRDVRAYMDGYATSAENANFIMQLSLFYRRNKLILNLIIAFFFLITSIISFSWIHMRESEQKALKSEGEALHALSKLKQEKAEKERLGLIVADEKCDQAIAAYLSYNYAEAYKLLNESLKLNPQNGRTLYYLGWLSLTAQKFSEARYYFERSKLYKDKSGMNRTIGKFTPVIDAMEQLVAPHSDRIDHQTLVDYLQTLPQKRYTVLMRHILYRHQNNLLDINIYSGNPK